MQKKVKSVTGILFSLDKSQVLLIERRDVPVWVLPGGGIEEGESSEEALIREMQEETGLRVEVKRLVGTYHPINRLAKTTHLYECVWKEGEPCLSNETRNVAFFPLAKLPALIPPPYREWITDGLTQEEVVEKSLTSVTYFTLLKAFFSHPLLVLRFLLARLNVPINR